MSPQHQFLSVQSILPQGVALLEMRRTWQSRLAVSDGRRPPYHPAVNLLNVCACTKLGDPRTTRPPAPLIEVKSVLKLLCQVLAHQAPRALGFFFRPRSISLAQPFRPARTPSMRPCGTSVDSSLVALHHAVPPQPTEQADPIPPLPLDRTRSLSISPELNLVTKMSFPSLCHAILSRYIPRDATRRDASQAMRCGAMRCRLLTSYVLAGARRWSVHLGSSSGEPHDPS